MVGFAMPTVLTVRNIRVVIYTNDHPPPHVHAVHGNECHARFALNCPDGPPDLLDSTGFKATDINELGDAIDTDLTRLCRIWRDIHD